MVELDARQIVSYLDCPAKTKLSHFTPRFIQLELFDRVTKLALQYQVKKKHHAPWRRMSTWLNRELKVFARSSDEWGEGISLLSRLYKWYHEIYIIGPNHVIVSVPMVIPLGVGVVFHDIIDIIELDDSITLTDSGWIDSINSAASHWLYRDTLTHIKVWAFNKVFDQMPTRYSRYCLSPHSVTRVGYRIREQELARTEQAVLHAARGMVAGIYYPSVSQHCEGCIVRPQCKF